MDVPYDERIFSNRKSQTNANSACSLFFFLADSRAGPRRWRPPQSDRYLELSHSHSTRASFTTPGEGVLHTRRGERLGTPDGRGKHGPRCRFSIDSVVRVYLGRP